MIIMVECLRNSRLIGLKVLMRRKINRHSHGLRGYEIFGQMRMAETKLTLVLGLMVTSGCFIFNGYFFKPVIRANLDNIISASTPCETTSGGDYAQREGENHNKMQNISHAFDYLPYFYLRCKQDLAK